MVLPLGDSSYEGSAVAARVRWVETRGRRARTNRTAAVVGVLQVRSGTLCGCCGESQATRRENLTRRDNLLSILCAALLPKEAPSRFYPTKTFAGAIRRPSVRCGSFLLPCSWTLPRIHRLGTGPLIPRALVAPPGYGIVVASSRLLRHLHGPRTFYLTK
jgi:hypothetical protein